MVSGVGHCHWELQHALCETRSTPGCLSPAGLAYVWLDHVPGEVHLHFLIEFCSNIHPLLDVGEEGPRGRSRFSGEEQR